MKSQRRPKHCADCLWTACLVYFVLRLWQISLLAPGFIALCPRHLGNAQRGQVISEIRNERGKSRVGNGNTYCDKCQNNYMEGPTKLRTLQRKGSYQICGQQKFGMENIGRTGNFGALGGAPKQLRPGRGSCTGSPNTPRWVSKCKRVAYPVAVGGLFTLAEPHSNFGVP